MGQPSPTDPVAAFTQVLSEVIDVVGEVKQAHRKVPSDHDFHAQLDNLFADLGDWARALMEEDVELGSSPLEAMSSVAGRQPPNLWPRGATDDEIRSALLDHLGRLDDHLSAALAAQDDVSAKELLAQIHRQLSAHVEALRA